MDLKKYIRSIPDYPKKGILFRDITTLIKDENAFKSCIDKIVEISKKISFDKIAAIESRGFIFSSPISYILNKPIVLLRKENKLPADKFSVDFKLEYGDAKLEVHKDSIKKNEITGRKLKKINHSLPSRYACRKYQDKRKLLKNCNLIDFFKNHTIMPVLNFCTVLFCFCHFGKR